MLWITIINYILQNIENNTVPKQVVNKATSPFSLTTVSSGKLSLKAREFCPSCGLQNWLCAEMDEILAEDFSGIQQANRKYMKSAHSGKWPSSVLNWLDH